MPELEVANDELGILQKGDEDFDQIPASGFNPTGGAAAATVVEYGIGTALKFANALENVAAVDRALRNTIDRTIAPTMRLGWSCDANTGNIRYGVTYLYIGADDNVIASGTEVLGTDSVPAVVDTYKFTTLTLGLIPADARVIRVRVTRYGADVLDTSAGDVFLLGAILSWTKGSK